LKVIRQGIVLWAQVTQDVLGVLIDVLEPDWGHPAAVETVERDAEAISPDTLATHFGRLARRHSPPPETPDTARPGTW
jgi:hypothetical protein